MKTYTLLASFIIAVISSGCGGDNDSLDTEINYPSGGYSSLQEAIDNLATGGTINIEPGVYKENIVFRNKVVHLQGDMNQSVIDGQGTTCITIINSSGSTVSSLTIVNCIDGISTNSSITIRDNYFFNNKDGVDYEGGGGLLDNNIFHMNTDDAIDLDLNVAVVISNNIISGSIDDGIEIRLHPYIGNELKTVITNNIFENNNANGIQFIDYEIHTNRSFVIKGNTFIESGYSEISYSDNQDTSPSFNIGEIVEPVSILSNIFYPSVYSFTGAGDNTVFENNFVYSATGDGNLNTTNDISVDDNTFIQIN